MISLSDLIVPPLAAVITASLIGLAVAILRTRARSMGLLAVDAAILFPALIPTPVLIGALLGGFGAGTDRESLWFAAIVIVSIPLAYLPARIALSRIDPQYRDEARLVGLGPIGRFFHIDLPLAWPWLALGALLVLTRVAGEWMLAIGALERITAFTVLIGLLSLVAALATAGGIARLSSR